MIFISPLPSPSFATKLIALSLAFLALVTISTAFAESGDKSEGSSVVRVVSQTRGVVAIEEIELTPDMTPVSEVTVLIDGDTRDQIGNPESEKRCEGEKLDQDPGGSSSISGNCVGAPFNC